MKTIVKLTVLMVIFLLLAGVALAKEGPCYDYAYTRTDLDSGFIRHGCVELCFDYGNNMGTYEYLCGGAGNLVLFFDSMNMQAVLYTTSGGPHWETGYLKFHGNHLHVFNGILYCGNPGGEFTYDLRGIQVDECDDGI